MEQRGIGVRRPPHRHFARLGRTVIADTVRGLLPLSLT